MLFRKEYKALKPEDALEILYSEFGGRYKVKRTKINMTEANAPAWKKAFGKLLK